jgi:hypothetical protein
MDRPLLAWVAKAFFPALSVIIGGEVFVLGSLTTTPAFLPFVGAGPRTSR